MPCIIDLPVETDNRGQLVWAEVGKHLPFLVRRVFYLVNVPQDAARGGHAHKKCHQLFIALAGGCLVYAGTEDYRLNNPACALYVEPGVKVTLSGFTPGCVCLVLASEGYDPGDYVRD